MVIVVAYLVYIGLAALVAMFGKEHKFGAWGYFFASLLFTPFIGLLLVMASDPLPRAKVTPVAAKSAEAKPEAEVLANEA